MSVINHKEMEFQDKYGLTTALSRRKAGLPPLGNLRCALEVLNVNAQFYFISWFVCSLKEGDNKPLEITPSQATESPDPLPESFFTEPLQLPLGRGHLLTF